MINGKKLVKKIMSNAGFKQNSADSQRNGFVKDSFRFKMSKKVAELTQVQYFKTRNL